MSAERDVARWIARTGNRDPARRLSDAEKSYSSALGGTAADIANARRARDDASAQNRQYQALNAKADTARSDESSAQEAVDAAGVNLGQASSVTMSPIQQERIAEGRSPGRLSLAAIMLVLAIAAADAIFLTRVKVPRPLPDATRAPARAPQALPSLAPEPARAPTP